MPEGQPIPAPRNLAAWANRLAPERNREAMDGDKLSAGSGIGVDVKRASEIPGVSARRIMLVLLAAVPLVFLAYGLVAWQRGWPLGVDSSVYRAGPCCSCTGIRCMTSTTWAT